MISQHCSNVTGLAYMLTLTEFPNTYGLEKETHKIYPRSRLCATIKYYRFLQKEGRKFIMKDSVINEIEILTNFPMKNENTRSRAERRKLNAKHAMRKRNKDRALRSHQVDFEDWYDNLHEYSKGKIHCSCPACSGVSKTNSKKVNKGGAKPQIRFSGFGTTNHRKGKNYKPSEIRKIEAMDLTIE